MITVEVRCFNSLLKLCGQEARWFVALPAGSTAADVFDYLDIPVAQVFLVLLNGRNITRGFGMGRGVEDGHRLKSGDVLALSGAVPYSRGYGAPVI